MSHWRDVALWLIVLTLASTGCWRFFGTEEDGATCYTERDCHPDQICSSAGTCVCHAAECDGCCGDDGRCHDGDRARACGVGGSSCVRCSDDQQCSDSGICSCVAEECDGCCDADHCLDGDDIDACGASGGPCQRCSEEGMECLDGLCVFESCDECPNPGARECTPLLGENAYRLCGDIGQDGCLEWRSRTCEGEGICDIGTGLCVDPECAGIVDPCRILGEHGCLEGYTDVFKCREDQAGCLSWQWYERCSDEAPCWNGECSATCDEPCELYDYPQCRESDPHYIYECVAWEGHDAEMCVARRECTNSAERCPAGYEECCFDQCSLGEIDCDGGTGLMWECDASYESGCLEFDYYSNAIPCDDWDISFVCEVNEYGVDDECVDVCPDECDATDDAPYCDSGPLPVRHYCQAVTIGDSGQQCWTWDTEDCESGSICVEGRCRACPVETTGGCDDEREFDCEYNGMVGRDLIRRCTMASNGCLVWSEWIHCNSGEECTEGELCTYGCINECSPEATQCAIDYTSMQFCVEFDMGCWRWSVPIQCSGDSTCDPDAGACPVVD